MITGPDGYEFRLLPQEPSRPERFQYVALRVSELPKAVEFYGDVLGMTDVTWDYEHLDFNRGGEGLMRFVGYTFDQVPLCLFEDPMASDKLKLEQWEGRSAIAIPESALRGVYRWLTQARPDSVVHSLQEFDERCGKLVIAIIRDEDGYEICMVSSETYDKAIAAAYTPDQDIDWAWREQAAAGERSPRSMRAWRSAYRLVCWPLTSGISQIH